MPRPDDYCPIHTSLDLFGDRWSLLVVLEINRGVTRFNELERNLPGISQSTLAQRLRQLEKAGIVERRTGDGGRSTRYETTEAGQGLRHVIDAVGAWGVRWLVPQRPTSSIDPDDLMDRSTRPAPGASRTAYRDPVRAPREEPPLFLAPPSGGGGLALSGAPRVPRGRVRGRPSARSVSPRARPDEPRAGDGRGQRSSGGAAGARAIAPQVAHPSSLRPDPRG
jgi:DNA-binding HxlR family transcriptional regulator